MARRRVIQTTDPLFELERDVVRARGALAHAESLFRFHRDRGDEDILDDVSRKAQEARAALSVAMNRLAQAKADVERKQP